MSAGTKTSTSKIALILVLIPIFWLAWWASDLFVPKWRWLNMDFEKVTRMSSLSLNQIKTEYDITVRYNPRGSGDPAPWQIVFCSPSYDTIDSQASNETDVLVRCHFLSDFTGSEPSKLMLGSGGEAGYRDRYFTAKAWRFPAGSFNIGNTRPVVVFRNFSLKKMDVGQSQPLDQDIRVSPRWSNDDNWEGRADGFLNDITQ